jgi:hypothetical protein
MPEIDRRVSGLEASCAVVCELLFISTFSHNFQSAYAAVHDKWVKRLSSNTFQAACSVVYGVKSVRE